MFKSRNEEITHDKVLLKASFEQNDRQCGLLVARATEWALCLRISAHPKAQVCQF